MCLSCLRSSQEHIVFVRKRREKVYSSLYDTGGLIQKRDRKREEHINRCLAKKETPKLSSLKKCTPAAHGRDGSEPRSQGAQPALLPSRSTMQLAADGPAMPCCMGICCMGISVMDQ